MSAEPDEVQKPPVSYRIGRQLDQEKIDVLTKRVEELVGSNTVLRANADRNGKDTHDIVLYFQREMEVKDDIIARLNEEMVKKESQLRNEVDKVRRALNVEFAEYKKESMSTIEDLRSRLSSSESALNVLDSYKINKAKHDQDLADLRAALADQTTYTKTALEEQERKQIEAKAIMIKDMEDQKTAFRNIALNEARQSMSVESKKIIAENIRLHEELKFHHAMTIELQSEKSAAEARLKTLQRDYEVLSDKDMEYARQAFVKSKEIKSLRDRVDQLEKAQVVNTERFKMRAKELKGAVQKDLEEATLDAAGLRRLMKIKNKELRIMKSLAATILSQRSDMEQFFLEALTEVKDKIRAEKKRTKAENTLNSHRLKREGAAVAVSGNGTGTGGPSRSPRRGPDGEVKVGGTFPDIHPSRTHHLDNRGPSEFPLQPDEKVLVSDLGWEDKELVLRVLFAKMNGLKQSLNNTLLQAKKGDANNRNASVPQVFVSEGAVENGANLEMADFMDAFEVKERTGFDFNDSAGGAEDNDDALDAHGFRASFELRP